MSSDRGIDREYMVHGYNDYNYYSAIRRNEIMPFAATWMDLEVIVLSTVRQTEKDKYHVSHICVM